MSTNGKNGTSRLSLWISITLGTIAVASFLGGIGYSMVSMSNEQVLQRERSADQSRRLETQAGEISALRLAVARQETALNEIETQFCSADNMRNLMHAADLRNYAIVYEKLFGVTYPVGNAYYPTICNRKSK